MTDLVTLTEAKDYLRVTDTRDDDTLAILIAAASDHVRDVADRWDGTGEIPARLKLAALARIAETFENREQMPEAKNELRTLYALRGIAI